MDQQFVLGLIAGAFIVVTFYLLVLLIQEWWEKELITSTITINSKQRRAYIGLYLFAFVLLIGSFWWFINTGNPKSNLDYFINEKNLLLRNIFMVIIYFFELVAIIFFTIKVPLKPQASQPGLVRAAVCWVLTLVFVMANLIYFYTDFSDTKSYSSLGFGAIGISITIFIAVLTFKDE